MRGSVTRDSPARGLGILLLLAVVLANAAILYPELRIGTVPLNDGVFHVAAAERMEASLRASEPLLDAWVSEWSLGYPIWRSYQPLPHLLAAVALKAGAGFTQHAQIYAAIQYILLLTLPLTIFVSARLFGLNPLAAGLAAALALAPSSSPAFSGYGLGYDAFVWRGTGLYTQLLALHFLALFLGLLVRVLDAPPTVGRSRMSVAAAILLASVVLSHLVFAYVAALSAIVCAVVGPAGARWRRVQRLIRIAAPAAGLVLWFIVPLYLTRGEINHSRWEPAVKWQSHGASVILQNLSNGELLDAGRFPVLSLVLGMSLLAALGSWRQALPRRLLALCAVWLLLFFGRATWGRLVLLVGIPSDFHMHRLQAAFELAAVLLAAWGGAELFRRAQQRNWLLALGWAVLLAIGLVDIGLERARYLHLNTQWGEANLTAYDAERQDLAQALATARAILAVRPGRVSAGKAATWGNQFTVGSVPVHAFLSREHFDQVSFLYHAMSLTSDVMVLRDEWNPGHDLAFGVRAVIAPETFEPAPHLQLRGHFGRFLVYEASPEGYFGLVDVGARYVGARADWVALNAAWLTSELQSWGVVIALDDEPADLPVLAAATSLPRVTDAWKTPRGRILEETKDAEVYRARVAVERPCYAFVKITWFPDLTATVDGTVVPVLRVSPGFAAVPLSAGEHTVVVGYVPSPLKPFLLIVGFVAFAIYAWRATA